MILYTRTPYNQLIVYKSVFQVATVLGRDWSLSECVVSYILWNLPMQEEVLYLT
jgi:hypothetical protein